LVQIDHTLVDVIVVDEIERKPIGRPWLTLVVDVATRNYRSRNRREQFFAMAFAQLTYRESLRHIETRLAC
jgi:hypothetical protein